MRQLCVLLLVTLLPAAAAAQNPCTTALTTTVLNPTKAQLTLPEHTATIPGVTPATPIVTNYTFAYWREGQDPNTTAPTQGPSTLPKTAFTLVGGTTNCYEVSLPAPVPSSGVSYVGAFRAHRDANATLGLAAVDSPWSGVSNPFVEVSTALAAPGRPNIRQ